MKTHRQQVEVLWSHLDPNLHVRHSIYYDWAVASALNLVCKNGLSIQILSRYRIGPVFSREECVFKQEIQYGDQVEICSSIVQLHPKARYWTLYHEIWKNSTICCACITVNGMWMDLKTRKPTALPPAILQTFDWGPAFENPRYTLEKELQEE